MHGLPLEPQTNQVVFLQIENQPVSITTIGKSFKLLLKAAHLNKILLGDEIAPKVFREDRYFHYQTVPETSPFVTMGLCSDRDLQGFRLLEVDFNSRKVKFQVLTGEEDTPAAGFEHFLADFGFQYTSRWFNPDYEIDSDEFYNHNPKPTLDEILSRVSRDNFNFR